MNKWSTYITIIIIAPYCHQFPSLVETNHLSLVFIFPVFFIFFFTDFVFCDLKKDISILVFDFFFLGGTEGH